LKAAVRWSNDCRAAAFFSLPAGLPKAHKKPTESPPEDQNKKKGVFTKSMKSPQKVHQRTKKEQRGSSQSPQKTHTETTKRPPVLWFYFFSQGKGG
jgi:hypothetical protein